MKSVAPFPHSKTIVSMKCCSSLILHTGFSRQPVNIPCRTSRSYRRIARQSYPSQPYPQYCPQTFQEINALARHRVARHRSGKHIAQQVWVHYRLVPRPPDGLLVSCPQHYRAAHTRAHQACPSSKSCTALGTLALLSLRYGAVLATRDNQPDSSGTG